MSFQWWLFKVAELTFSQLADILSFIPHVIKKVVGDRRSSLFYLTICVSVTKKKVLTLTLEDHHLLRTKTQLQVQFPCF